MKIAIPNGSPVYIRYKDHVLLRSNMNSVKDHTERETMGWLAKEAGDWVYIHHDVPIKRPRRSRGSGKGMLLKRSSILEIRLMYKKGERVEAGSTVHH